MSVTGGSPNDYVPQKHCSFCDTTKPLCEFYDDPRGALGKRSRCRACVCRRKRNPTYTSWQAMIARCYDTSHVCYENYGGRGITVCEKWGDFSVFLTDMGARPSNAHSLDRINNDGNYEPGNCRWATSEQQIENKGNRKFATLDGVKRSVVEWSKISGVHRRTISHRLDAGWDVRSAIYGERYAGRLLVRTVDTGSDEASAEQYSTGGAASTVTSCDTPGSRASGATHRNPAAHGRAPQQIWILMGRDSSPSSWLSSWLISAHSNEQDADEAKTLWLQNVGRRFDAYVIAVELS